MSKNSAKEGDIVPEVIYDHQNGRSYKRLAFFGKGGFAKCYEIVDLRTDETFAGKVVPKRLLKKGNQKEKMTSEIKIHKSLKHANVVQFHNFFDDNLNVYIILELCRKRSMMELHRRRKAITEPEARFFMKQILEGVSYLHRNDIIHRDLKLGNLFLDDNLTVKIGDFGLAAKLEFAGERKKYKKIPLGPALGIIKNNMTLCGTPNYIAPEILNKNGHSFEVDMWSIGCIMYTLLVGKPPFETNSLKETYSRIKNCDYVVPKTVPQLAEGLIGWLLQPDPRKRPRVDQAARHDWFNGFTPKELPTSVLVSAPRFPSSIGDDSKGPKGRKPLSELNSGNSPILKYPNPSSRHSLAIAGSANTAMVTQYEVRKHMESLVKQLKQLLSNMPVSGTAGCSDEDGDPAAQPLTWISKWVDYSDKYGFGFQLIDGSWGVLFNDTTKIVMLANEINVHYIHKDGREEYFTKDVYPAELEKKMRLLTYFRKYMHEHLQTAGMNVQRTSDSVSRTPYLYQWFRNSQGIFMCLTNGTIQVNFIDHKKIILCPLMSAVTFLDTKSFRTYRFSTLETSGCAPALAEALKYAYQKLSINLKNCVAAVPR